LVIPGPIATRFDSSDATVNYAGWVVILISSDEQTCHGHTPAETLTSCLVWRMTPLNGIGQFLV
jgi:hypothetical protein